MGTGVSRDHLSLTVALTTLSPEQRAALLLPPPAAGSSSSPRLPQHLLRLVQGGGGGSAPAAEAHGAAAARGSSAPSSAARQEQEQQGQAGLVPGGPAGRPPPPPPPQQQQQQQQQAAARSGRLWRSRLSRLLPPSRKHRPPVSAGALDSFDDDSPWWEPDRADEAAAGAGGDRAGGTAGQARASSSTPSPLPWSSAPPPADFPDPPRWPGAPARRGPPAASGNAVAPVAPRRRRKLYPYTFGELQSTVNISLCSLGIVKLSPRIGLLHTAVTMQLCCNALTLLPPTFTNLVGLTRLDISRNNLSRLPANIGDLNRLTELRVANNSLTALPPSIGRLARLELLSVAWNKLESLPDEVGTLEQLADLDIAGNAGIRYLPAAIGRLKKLRQVRVRGCGLTTDVPGSPAAAGRDAGAAGGGEEARRGPAARMPSLKELCARALLRRHPELHAVAAGAPARLDRWRLEMPPLRRAISSVFSGPSPSPAAAPRPPPAESIARSQTASSLGSLASRGLRKSRSRSLPTAEFAAAPGSPASPAGSPASPASSSQRRRPSQQRQKAAAAGAAVLERARHLPQNLLAYLASAHRCSFCGGPYLDWYVPRYRFINRKIAEGDDDGAAFEGVDGGGGGGVPPGGSPENRLPLEYRLCTNHWRTESERLLAMFAPMAATAPAPGHGGPRPPDLPWDRSPSLRRSVSSLLFGS